jgi:pimeloyl-ACP methyl ester carboxylesterase
MSKEGVVLLHGIFRSSFSMSEMAICLRFNGFKVLNLDYPSRNMKIQEIADVIHQKIEDFARNVSKIHFVGHSMGGLVIRAYLNKYRPINLGKAVFVGTPNSGSELADSIKEWQPYKKLYGPAGQQLVTNSDQFNELGKIDYLLLVIAGNKCKMSFRNKFFNGESDGTVSVKSTKIEGMSNHVIMPYGHTFIITKRKVIQKILQFIKD